MASAAEASHALSALRIATFALEQAKDSLGPAHELASGLGDVIKTLGRYHRQLSFEGPPEPSVLSESMVMSATPQAIKSLAASATDVDDLIEESTSPRETYQPTRTRSASDVAYGAATSKAAESRAASATDVDDLIEEELTSDPANEVDAAAAATASGADVSDDDESPGDRVAAIDALPISEDVPTFGELVMTHSQPEYAKKNMEEGEAMHLLYRGRCKELYLQMDRNGDGSLSPAELSSAAPKLGMTVEQLNEIFTKADRDKGGSLSIDEFVEMMGEHFGNLIEDLDEVHDSDGNAYKADETTHLSFGHKEFLKLGNSRYLFSPFDTPTQIVEINVMVILFATLFTTPMALAFKPFEEATYYVDLCIDSLFMADIVRNFNTAYFTSDDVIVFDQRAVFKHYVSAGVDAF